jgi:hypothetical protein
MPNFLYVDNSNVWIEGMHVAAVERDEIARERELQKDYERIWLPAPVKHSSGADRNRVDCDADRSASALHRPPWPCA